MSRYDSLQRFLDAQPLSRLRLDFEEIEKILTRKLPNSAYQYDAWWSNNVTGHSHARAWLTAGWRTEGVDRAGQKVTFIRIAAPSHGVRRIEKRDPWGCMSGTVTIMPGIDLCAPLDEEWNAEKGLLVNE